MNRAKKDVQRRTGRPTKQEAAAIADVVLDGARTLFGQRGYATSMDEIAAACGVSKLTIYRRYPSKEALLFAVIDRDLERHSDASRMTLEAGLAPMDALRVTAREMFDLSMRPEAMQISRLLAAEGSTNENLRLRLSDWLRLANGPAIAAIKAAQAAGDVIDEDPEQLAEMLRDLLDGLPRRLRLRHVPAPSNRDAGLFFDQRWNLFVRGVSAVKAR